MDAPGSIISGVLMGKEGELFLAHGGHAVLDYACGRRQVDPAMFAIYERNILDRAASSKHIGASYLHVIFPDKQSVVRHRFPFADPVCLGLLYEERCLEAATHTLNLTGVLRAQAQPVFKRTDTHVNDYGLAVAASAIMAALGFESADEALGRLMERPTKTLVLAGDLGMRLNPQLSAAESYIMTDWPIQTYSNSLVLNNDGLADIHISPASIYPTRVLWFGDSFGRGCARLLSLFFREIIFLRTRFLHQEMVASIRPDVVVTQTVERYLDVIAPDEEAMPFLLYPSLKQLPYAPDLPFATAMSAMLSYPRTPYQRFIAELARGAATRGPAG